MNLRWQMAKRAGVAEAMMSAPFSALAAAISAPEGDRGKATAIGAALGAGMAAMAEKEIKNRQAEGDPVELTELLPLFKIIMAGLAVGGVMKAMKEREKGRISTDTAVLAGAPIGALAVSDHPIIGSILGGVTAPWLARQVSGPREDIPPEIRARAAILAAQQRIAMARRGLLIRG